MAEKRKFAGISAELNPEKVQVPIGVPLGRPKTGKRSNPVWKQGTYFFNIKRQKAAARILADRDDGQDFSDLLDALLARWLSEQAEM